MGLRRLWPYLLGAVLLWYAVLLSGVHATVAGVLAAAAIPIVATPGTPDSADSPLHRLEHGLSPWVAFLIVPLFGFANAGVSLAGVGLDRLLAPLPLGIAAGLFVGKQLGIFAAVWVTVRLGFAARLRGATWLQVWGVAMLCGIGFTMSLFIGALAFPDDPARVEDAKLGILAGSLLSALGGYAVLRLAPGHDRHEEEEKLQEGEIEADGDVERLEERKA
jgi:NhaA family Na+:H+ antiporter